MTTTLSVRPAHRLHRWQRWVLACGVAEAVGMTAAAGAATLANHRIGEPATATEVAAVLALVVTGGLVEGVALGTAQSRLLAAEHPAVRRTRYVAATVLVAGLGWAAASAPTALAGAGDPDAAPPPYLLVVLGGAGLGLAMGPLLGAAQAWALRGSGAPTGRWVLANTVAWVPAMAIIFAGATAPDASTVPLVVVALGSVTGAIAGASLGAVLAALTRRS